jgi:hypothetical protein
VIARASKVHGEETPAHDFGHSVADSRKTFV